MCDVIQEVIAEIKDQIPGSDEDDEHLHSLNKQLINCTKEIMKNSISEPLAKKRCKSAIQVISLITKRKKRVR